MKKLFLLDAMALIYRAHFAFSKNPRINSQGLNTGAVLGFTNTLLEVIEKQAPSHLAVAFDTAEPTFRHEQFEAYKANREAQPEDITSAIPYIYQLLEAFRVPVLVKPGYEADDLIGTVAKKAAQTGEFEVFMMTPDKDYAQLVEENIYLYKPAFMGNAVDVLGVPEVLKKFDIARVEQVIDLLGLQGDAVDNIPGIPGVGAKTAVKLLKEFDSVEGVLANVDKLKGKQQERVRENADKARLSKQLATIDVNVPIDFKPEDFVRQDLNPTAVKTLFAELEFRTLHKRLFPEDAPKTSAKKSAKKAKTAQISLFGSNENPEAGTSSTSSLNASLPNASINLDSIANKPHYYQKIEGEEAIKTLVAYLQKQPAFCVDTETTSLEVQDATLVGLAFAAYAGEAYYVPIPPHSLQNIPDSVKNILAYFRPVLENKQITKVGQNLKYDYAVLQNYEIRLAAPMFDTMLAHYLLEPESRHNLDRLAEQYLHYSPMSIEELIGKKGKKQGNMRDVPIEKVVEYAGEDADLTWQLYPIFEAEIKRLSATDSTASLAKVFHEIEMPLLPVLAEMERNGIYLDTAMLQEFSEELQQEISQLAQRIYQAAGEDFNLNSPKQLGDILFAKLKLDPKAKKTKTGQYATGEEVLLKIADKHQIVQDILEYRGLDKLKSTYVDALPKLVSRQDHRVHTSYNQAVTATGRLSSANPNLQNIPIRTEKGRLIRKAFAAKDPKHVLMAADYSQIELRIMAALSQDDTMIEAFRKGRDIHAITAARLFKVDLEQVDSDMRRKAKSANFGIIYGSSAHGLAQNMGISRSEAGEIIRAYFEEFSAIKSYMDRLINEAREQGYVETIFGRRRYLPNINSRNRVERGHAERNAINTPIQGSAADMIKLAMIRIQAFIEEKQLESRMLLQVHDELVFEVPQSEVELMRENVEELMKNALELPVPMAVEVGIGQNWLEAH